MFENSKERDQINENQAIPIYNISRSFALFIINLSFFSMIIGAFFAGLVSNKNNSDKVGATISFVFITVIICAGTVLNIYVIKRLGSGKLIQNKAMSKAEKLIIIGCSFGIVILIAFLAFIYYNL